MRGKIEIFFQGFFREITKERKIIEEIEEGYTVAIILKNLANKYGKDFNEIFDINSQKISSEVLIMLNGRGIHTADIKVNDKDTILVGVPIGGGSIIKRYSGYNLRHKT